MNKRQEEELCVQGRETLLQVVMLQRENKSQSNQLVRLDSPFITDSASVSVFTGHFETATNPLEQIRSLEQPDVLSSLQVEVWGYFQFKETTRTTEELRKSHSIWHTSECMLLKRWRRVFPPNYKN